MGPRSSGREGFKRGTRKLWGVMAMLSLLLWFYGSVGFMGLCMSKLTKLYTLDIVVYVKYTSIKQFTEVF